MANTKDFLVIGLGRFGSSVVKTLLERGQRVTIVDLDERKLLKFQNQTEYAKVADTRDEEVLAQIGVNNYDAVVVAIGSNIEANIITTLLLKDMGVEHLIVKASNAQHKSALLKIGIDERDIILPEVQAGMKVAVQLAHPIVADYVSLIGEKFGIIEMYPKKTHLSNKTLSELKLKEKYNVMVAAIKRGDEIILPNRDTLIGEDDSLIVIGEDDSLDEFEGLF
ncbi:potassium channel family protein [Mycoplasma sp. P36-A1]|uniref:potassium channel family protein n=1 Tax=Mycoplasma sp. P36-A1 TaxID=3252900 RepID=UPI003C2F89E8